MIRNRPSDAVVPWTPRRGRSILFLLALVVLAAAMFGPSTNVAIAAGKPGYPDKIGWGGRTWQVKSSQSKVGPGPNYFSASGENVWVDAWDRLHLQITSRNGRWNCAEIIGADSFGYGTYTFDIASPLDDLDPNVVLGLFTWSDKSAYNHREIDIEFARWGAASDPTNAQYVVQPYSIAGHLQRWTLPTGAAPTTHAFMWRSGRVDFASVASGWNHSWAYIGSDVPKPGGENPRLNLWLFGGTPPTDGLAVEIVVNSFSFTP